jgi:hypothetical protein
MAKRDMKQALGASLKAEEQAVRSRFEKAKTVLREKPPTPREQPKPEPAAQVNTDNFTVPDCQDELISRIRRRCLKMGIRPDKSEVLTAGLDALDAMPDRDLERLLVSPRRVETRRPQPAILTLIIHQSDIVKFRRRFQIKPSPSARQVLIGRRIATITVG